MQLLCRKAFSGVTSCPQHLKQICKKILHACQGLPLAIEVIGSVLSTRRQTMEDWELFYKSMGVEMERNNQLVPIKKLLSLSYYDLPNHLKICFLYLSIYPEDAKIRNDDLAKLWIAEGFVERINETGKQGNIVVVRVHDIIRHIILLKASEHNITTVFRGQEEISFSNNVKRLSVLGSISGNSEQVQSSCKSIRTLVLHIIIGGNISESHLSHLLSHGRKLIKVLDFHDAQLERIPNEIFKLFQLKYKDLSRTKVKCVPKSIGMLQSLQTLNLLNTHVAELPVEIQKLQQLRHLIIGRFHSERVIETFEKVQGVRASLRIGKLKSLQQLMYTEADQVDNISIVSEIGKLLQLRKLGITKLKTEDGKELCSSLVKLTELRELIVYSVNEDEVIDFQYFSNIELVRATGKMSRMDFFSSPTYKNRSPIRQVKRRPTGVPPQSDHSLPY
ncbi:antimicrobial response protein [Lithospermum erythrorhizon]|uniref:Antimicrobial response protein n=1 Tax=Lithospermum erythrorhizon TaxID=34254 RepID=A0AAV3Q078_LITER